MKFKLSISNVPGKGDSLTNSPKETFEFEGDLDQVKTFAKLKIETDKFNFGNIQRLDCEHPGDVEHWFIGMDIATRELNVEPFAFHDVDAEINLNAMRAATDPRVNIGPASKLLGGGKL